jgi:hypothetical protein
MNLDEKILANRARIGESAYRTIIDGYKASNGGAFPSMEELLALTSAATNHPQRPQISASTLTAKATPVAGTDDGKPLFGAARMAAARTAGGTQSRPVVQVEREPFSVIATEPHSDHERGVNEQIKARATARRKARQGSN